MAAASASINFNSPSKGDTFWHLASRLLRFIIALVVFNAQVVGLADVRVTFTLSPTGSSLPPPSSFKELESQNSCHQAPIRRTSEPYSNSGMLHTRYELGHSYQATHRAGSPFATALRAPTSAELTHVFMQHPKKARLSWITRTRSLGSVAKCALFGILRVSATVRPV